MKISRTDLGWAASEGLITSEQANALWSALEGRQASSPRFDLPHVAYYFGALVVISAMSWFMTLGWERLGGLGIFVVSIAYATVFVLAGRRLWSRPGLRVPGGLLITLAVWMTPLAIYGLERATGLWPQGDPGAYRDYHVWIKGSWFLMELGTIAAGLFALRFVRFPFLTFPIAFSLWYMSMDLTPLLLRRPSFSWDERLWVSLLFGLLMLVASYAVDRRTAEDYAFWGYLFGLLAFWGGLSLMRSGSELARLVYGLINVGLILVSVVLERRAFLVFGVLGVFGYLGYLSYRVFGDSLLFPFVLTGFGLGVIALGIAYHRHRAHIEAALLRLLPRAARALAPAARERDWPGRQVRPGRIRPPASPPAGSTASPTRRPARPASSRRSSS